MSCEGVGEGLRVVGIRRGGVGRERRGVVGRRAGGKQESRDSKGEVVGIGVMWVGWRENREEGESERGAWEGLGKGL